MYISLNWIKEFVDLSGIDNEEIVKRFVLSTAEIEDVCVKGEDTEGVVFAKILSVSAHPESQKLHILKVDKGDEVVQIVCGAPNVYEGMVTALATNGGKVCGHKIKPARLAGVESFGMCCSEAELGIGSDDSGIIDVKEDVTIGQDIKTVWPLNDIVFEIDNKSLTNRPDLWGHYGIAREFSAIFKKYLKPLEVSDLSKYDSLDKVDIKIDTNNCYRYSAITLNNIETKYSPMWMKLRLNYVGQRDINFLADMTNYLMLELGQPMHAFDNKKVKSINVIEAKKGAKLLTLEGEEHSIPENAVLIANENKEPVAIAGVKGGALDSISESTNSLLLESACFSPVSIRKTSLAVGLRTDSSLRYEKSLDPELTVQAISRFVKILHQIDKSAKVSSSLSDVQTFEYPKQVITITKDFVSRRIGIAVSKDDIVDILARLEFSVGVKGEDIIVSVPSFRRTKDISIKEDLVEEIARMHGYDSIKPENILSKVSPVSQAKEHICEYKAKRLLAEKYGVNEVHTYIWNYADFNKTYGIDTKPLVNLVDSSNSGQSGIRSQLVPSLLKVFEENKNSFSEIKICEIGRVCASLKEDGLCNEEKHLALVYASTHESEKDIYLGLKAMLENVAKSVMQTELTLDLESVNKPAFYHPANSVVVKSGEKEIGVFGLLHPSINIDKRFKVGILEVDFTKLSKSPIKQSKIKQISKYQDVNIDLNFLVPKDMMFRDVENLISKYRAKLDWKYSLVDIYENDKVLGNFKSITFSFNISSREHTLTSEEIEGFSKKLIEHMSNNNIKLR